MEKPGGMNLTRRRALFIGATFIGGALAARSFAAGSAVSRWSGQALGAHATIELAGADGALAQAVFAQIEREVSRLEAIFSLYRGDSALSRLNRTGELAAPPPELLELLALAGAVHRQTDGLFDPTVQPLFALFAEHYSAGKRGMPDVAQVEAALARVGFDAVRFDPEQVRFERFGMAMTLNGIAQGYITDRVAALLRERGFSNVLVDMGEIQAIGSGTEGNGWRVGIRQGGREDGISKRLMLTDRALATSMMLGTVFDQAGTTGHILHPRTGVASRFNTRASVVDQSAARADALSTAAILMDSRQIEALRQEGVELYL
ncbi:FAD:protein FMN transferase [Nitratireductor indicus]|uniref:FAD:protein FMN transferase n=1 Tax=Nitratireductor indicus TaxID=721133 RepID=UPI002873FF0D|nr:FAD:protein FMN transferase [Nitratireductor indicus]MDS1136394.1 FAD:protein FMN transferase [Nitratireductor indicus]